MFLNCNLSTIHYLEKGPNLGEQIKEQCAVEWTQQCAVERARMITYPELLHDGKVFNR